MRFQGLSFLVLVVHAHCFTGPALNPSLQKRFDVNAPISVALTPLSLSDIAKVQNRSKEERRTLVKLAAEPVMDAANATQLKPDFPPASPGQERCLPPQGIFI